MDPCFGNIVMLEIFGKKRKRGNTPGRKEYTDKVTFQVNLYGSCQTDRSFNRAKTVKIHQALEEDIKAGQQDAKQHP